MNGDDVKMNTKFQHFKAIIDDLHSNGQVDSGTKIQILKLLKDLSTFNYSKLRRPPKAPRRKFLMKLIHLKFDLKQCSFKEFSDNIQKIDNCAIKYIEHINDCKISIRDEKDLKIRNFLGELDITIESNNLKDLRNAEISLKRLADSFNYRLVKKLPLLSPNSNRTMSPMATKPNLKIGFNADLTLYNIPPLPLQSPTTSTPDDELTNSLTFLSKMQTKEDFLTSIDDTSMIEKYGKSSLNVLNCLF
jgi:hypothetical protein